MKCVCISCFNHYPTRFKFITEFFQQKGYDTYYLITDYLHFEKRYEKLNYPGVVHVHVPGYEKNMSLNRLYSHYVFSDRTYRLLESIRPDIIYCMFPPNILVKKCSQYKRRYPMTKLVFDCYDEWPESMTIKSKLLKIPLEIWKNLRDNYLEYADKVIAVSECNKKSITKKHPNVEIGVLYPRLIERPKISYCSDISDGIKFCYLGNINYITDIALTVALLGEVSKQKKVVLHHIGRGQNLGEFVHKLKMANVEYVPHGAVFDTEAKERIFSLCNMGINFPKVEIQSSMSLKSVEYMRSGLPFVNSGICDNWDIVKEYHIGYNCTTNSIQRVAKIIASTNRNELIQLHKNTLNCYDKLFGKPDYEELFSSVLNTGKGK